MTCDKKEMIAWLLYTPPPNMEMFSEKFGAANGSGKEIAGLLKKMITMKNYYNEKH